MSDLFTARLQRLKRYIENDELIRFSLCFKNSTRSLKENVSRGNDTISRQIMYKGLSVRFASAASSLQSK